MTDAIDLLDALLLPFADGALAWPVERPIAFLGAQDGWPLHRFALQSLRCEQPFRPLADALERGGLHVAADLSDTDATARDALVLVLPPRQRDAARTLLARAVTRARDGGRVVVCAPNQEGGKSLQDDLARLVGRVDTAGKNHCRVAWTSPLPADAHDDALRSAWLALDAPRPILDGAFTSRPGVFAWDRVDAASRLLADALPADLQGRVADLGAGWGFLSHALLQRCAGVHTLDLYEADARALALARTNLADQTPRVALGLHWRDVTRGIAGSYDAIVSNPPFHATGAASRPDIGRAFIATAAQALRPGGVAWFVANRHLAYEQALADAFARVTTHLQRDGFKVIEAVRA